MIELFHANSVRELQPLRYFVYVALIFVSAVLCYYTFISVNKSFHSDWQPPAVKEGEQPQYRLALITQELETPFWKQVASGALKQAEQEGATLEVLGSFGKNQEEFLKKLEIAIYSKVDGIIVQGLDTNAFKTLTRVKAAFYGIPIITVANDVPMADSLRRTYVGSDHYYAGQLIARELAADMGAKGKVILLGDVHREHYQVQRLNGIRDVLDQYPGIQQVYAESQDSREQVIATTQDLMNKLPDVNAFIAVNASFSGAMLQEIGRRSQVEPYYIYTFDDGPDSMTLLKQGKIDGVIEQAPEQMGQHSVKHMMDWLRGDTVPLDMNGYLTNIRMVKADAAS